MSTISAKDVSKMLESLKDNKDALLSLKAVIEPVLNTTFKCDEYIEVLTLLMWAVKKKYNMIVEVLLSFKPDINFQDRDSNTSLIWAAYKNSDILVDILLKAGATIDHQDGVLCTALHWAVEKRNFKMIINLLSCGASSCIKDRNGVTAVDCVTAWSDGDERTKILELMKKKTEVIKPEEPVTTEKPVTTKEPVTTDSSTNNKLKLSALQQIVIFMLKNQIDFKCADGKIETLTDGNSPKLEELALFMLAFNAGFLWAKGRIWTL